jgi:hypothetical protein
MNPLEKIQEDLSKKITENPLFQLMWLIHIKGDCGANTTQLFNCEDCPLNYRGSCGVSVEPIYIHGEVSPMAMITKLKDNRVQAAKNKLEEYAKTKYLEELK